MNSIQVKSVLRNRKKKKYLKIIMLGMFQEPSEGITFIQRKQASFPPPWASDQSALPHLLRPHFPLPEGHEAHVMRLGLVLCSWGLCLGVAEEMNKGQLFPNGLHSSS